jgi:16S rRNA processing protein RimM
VAPLAHILRAVAAQSDIRAGLRRAQHEWRAPGSFFCVHTMTKQTKLTSQRAGAAPAQVYYMRNQPVMVPAGCIAVGHIIGVHGLRGEVKVELYTDFPERFVPGAVLMVGDDLDEETIEQVREHKGNLLVKFAGCTNRTDAEALRNRWLFVDEADAAQLEEGVYWIHDIIGLEVFTEQGEAVGRITDVLATGSNDVYVVAPTGAFNRGREVLLPALDDVILNVALEQGRMTVRLPDGLLDE